MKVIEEKDIFYFENQIILVNYLTGACDRINQNLMKALENKKYEYIDDQTLDKLKSRKYIFDKEDDYNLFVKKINEKLIFEKEHAYPNFLIIPTYDCNLSCPYCFEKKYDICNYNYENNLWIDKVFENIDNIVRDYKKNNEQYYNSKNIEVTLMGGEPLLERNKSIISVIVQKIKDRGFSYDVVSNGVCIDEYMDIFLNYKPKYIQITLDGTKEYHDKRRVFKSGKGTFNRIIHNIQQLSKYKINVTIRLNLDIDNIDNLEEFIRYIEDFYKNNNYVYPYIYPVQDGGCLYNKNIGNELDYIKKVNCIRKKMKIEKFKFMFHGSELIDSIENNKKMKYKMYNCSAQNNQYIFDYKGNIYKCWFGVGNNKYAISNKGKMNKLEDDIWKNRNIFTLKKCKECKYRYICGGGCVNRLLEYGESINQPNCKNYYNLIEEQLKGII